MDPARANRRTGALPAGGSGGIVYSTVTLMVQRFHDDPEIRAALEVAKVAELREPTFDGRVTADAIASLRRDGFDVDLDALAQQGYGHERLDQLVTELLLGVR